MLLLQNESLRISDLDEIPSAFPDVCIAYKLHLECGKFINVVDWFQVRRNRDTYYGPQLLPLGPLEHRLS